LSRKTLLIHQIVVKKCLFSWRFYEMSKPFIMRQLLFILFAAFSITAYGQGESMWWFFGDNAGVDFNGGIPQGTTVGQLSTAEGCASISDECGNLLLYTDGSTLYNANHQIVPGANGTLQGNNSSAQSGIIVPDLQNPDLYFVVTVSGGSVGVKYTMVDMTLNGGLGGIVPGTLNRNVRSGTHEKISAVLHADGDSYWLMTYATGQYGAYRMQNGLISPTPVNSFIGSSLSDQRGTIKFNIAGTRVANTSVGDGATVARFDNATGVVSQQISLGGMGIYDSNYGVEFSPNGRFLYVDGNSTGTGNGCGPTNEQAIWQFDLDAPNFQFTPVEIYNTNGSNRNGRSALQLAINEKIYVSRTCQPWLGVIDKPNTAGTRAGYDPFGVDLSPRNSREGLPPFLTSLFAPNFNCSDPATGTVLASSSQDGDILLCASTTTNTSFDFEVTNELCNNGNSSVTWDFGDGSPTVSTPNPTHTFPGPGDYTVRLTISISGLFQRTDQLISIYEQPVANTVTDFDLCDTDMDGQESLDIETLAAPQVLGLQDPTNFEVTFHSSQTDADLNANPLTSPVSFATGTSTDVFARITNIRNANTADCHETTSFIVNVTSSLSAQRPTDLTVCDDDTDGFAVFDLTQTEPEVTANTPGPVSYYIDQADAVAGINEITNPAAFLSTTPNTQRIYIRLGGATATACPPSFTEVDLFVTPTPIANPIADKQLCDVDGSGDDDLDVAALTAEVLGSQTNPDFVVEFYPTQADADAGTNPLARPITVTSNLTVFVRVENQTKTECYNVTSFNAQLTGVPVANPVSPYRLCDDVSNNGSEVFDLPSRDSEVLDTQAAAGLNIDYFISQADADLGADGGATPLPDLYSSGGQIVYARIENTQNTDCYDTTSFELIIDTQPVTVTIPDYEICDDQNDGFEDVDLEGEFDAAVLGSQTIANSDITYYLSQADAAAGNNAQASPFSAPLGRTTIYARLFNTDNTDCFAISEVDIVLSPQAVANPLTEIRVCDDSSNDGEEVFDLTAVNSELLGAQDPSLFNIEYFSSQAEADQGTLNGATALSSNYNTPTTTVFVRIETSSNRECYDTETVDLFVDQRPRTATIDDLTVCDADNDGFVDANLSDFDAQVLDGQSSTQFIVSYYRNDADAQAGTNALASPSPIDATTPAIFVRVENIDNDSCPAITSFDFNISPTPIVNNTVDLVECDNPANPGVFMFDLGVNDAEILGSQDPSQFNINYYASASDRDNSINALPRMYLSSAVSAPETIYVRLESNLTSICPDFAEFTLKVDTTPVAGSPDIMTVCDDKEDGVELFDLESQTADVLNGQDPSLFEVTYHSSEDDSLNDVGALTSPYQNTDQMETIYVRIENRNNPDCFDRTLFDIEVFDRPEIQDQAPPVICAGVAETLDAGPGFASYLWSTGERTQTIDVVSEGDYTVTVTNAVGCDNTAVYRVRESDIAVFDRIVIGDFQVNTNEITVLVNGPGNYEYSLDDYNYQSSNVFDNLYPGFYTVYVNDRNGCGKIQRDVTVLGGPQFFTPNTDGFNDTWQIIGADLIPDAQVFIFDRQGRLLKQMSPTGPGWDGTFNGNPLPSSDYWYAIELTDGRRITGHFAMKR
jgi:gliding motility-associated-like protein